MSIGLAHMSNSLTTSQSAAPRDRMKLQWQGPRCEPKRYPKTGVFESCQIYQWFAANLHRVREPSMRHYVRARELKAAGMDWTEVLAAEAENKRARLAAELLASDAYGSTAAQAKAFVEQGEGAGQRPLTTAKAQRRDWER
jgi:CubicO group peptidase (beta-lactamase class C family)